MQPIQLKVGSSVLFPIPGWISATSSDTSKLTLGIPTAGQIKITAVAPGDVTVTGKVGSDLTASLTVTVVP